MQKQVVFCLFVPHRMTSLRVLLLYPIERGVCVIIMIPALQPESNGCSCARYVMFSFDHCNYQCWVEASCLLNHYDIHCILLMLCPIYCVLEL